MTFLPITLEWKRIYTRSGPLVISFAFGKTNVGTRKRGPDKSSLLQDPSIDSNLIGSKRKATLVSFVRQHEEEIINWIMYYDNFQDGTKSLERKFKASHKDMTGKKSKHKASVDWSIIKHQVGIRKEGLSMLASSTSKNKAMIRLKLRVNASKLAYERRGSQCWLRAQAKIKP
ncbi:hypothetical protein BCR43DRAFT_495101 [Syncephalastrum racemosum]|uniref:Uncharacterized protein n=1 Tax=Syncephalastrum racemosum TaxID=13706 RepID=A0A1X2H942_SYNRA|nr:hypothetical protein BCR43DRAFT_495101 [Syncephalastrum racemosum]